MNKAELVEAVAARTGDRRAAAAVVEALLATVQRTVQAGERVTLSGFGVFERVDRAARTARNPSTGEAVRLAATSVPRFRPGQAFKDVIAGTRELPVEDDAPTPARAAQRVPARSARAATTATSPAAEPGAPRRRAATRTAAADMPASAAPEVVTGAPPAAKAPADAPAKAPSRTVAEQAERPAAKQSERDEPKAGKKDKKAKKDEGKKGKKK